MPFDLLGGTTGGGYVYDWDQMQDPVIINDRVTRGGACIALSTWWIIKHRAEEDFWTWRKSASGAQAVRKVQEQETKLSAGGAFQQLALTAGLSFKERVELKLGRSRVILVAHGFRVVEDKMWPYSPPGLVVANQLTWAASRDVYSVLVVWGTDGGAHGMAAFAWRDGFLFMDPNHGEIYFPSLSRAKTWFRFWFDYEYKTQLFQGLNRAAVLNVK